MSLESQLKRLERLAAECTEESEIDPWWQASCDAGDALLLTMSDEHAGLILAEDEARLAHFERTGELYRTGHLYDLFHFMCVAQAQGRHERAYALPPAVCDVLINDSESEVHHCWSECEDCGLWLPHKKWLGSPHKVESIFAVCPLCGGRVGYFSFWIKQQRQCA